MIDRQRLLKDLQNLLKRLEADLLQRSESAEVPDVEKSLHAEYERAKSAQRTAQNYEDWRGDYITQAAAAWALSCVFVRFLEDNGLIFPPKIAGPGDQLQQARDEHELYFRDHPRQTDRDYVLAIFDELARLPGAKDVFGAHNPLLQLPNWLSGDAAGELLAFFQKIEADTGALVHDFTDADWNTRFLGDLYQDLSEAARKKYALLQTPEFVEEFILDRTLDPALDEFGLSKFKMIDPACGSGHFLLGAFRRILNRWQRQEPGANMRVLVQRTLDSIHGVDVNPYAVAISRFRLLLAAMRACGISRLADAPAFELHLACGDSLLHAPLSGGQHALDFELTSEDEECEHAYQSEDLPVLKQMLRGGQYHAVVANPPYITPKDRQLNERYRKRFTTCHMKYSLAVPFLERVFKLAMSGGYTGQITTNSFMKREFGKKLIEEFLPRIDLTHVIDTSGAYIPGHGTPTVILFGRRREPVARTIRAVMGIRGEPATPGDPAKGLIWSAIVEQIDRPGSQSLFVSVGDSSRELFGKHPWSIGGGGAAELKERLENSTTETLSSQSDSIGFASFTGQDEAFVADYSSLARASIPHEYIKQFVVGDTVRDWAIDLAEFAFAPYDDRFEPIAFSDNAHWSRWMWPMRTAVGAVVSFAGKTRLECGDKWWTWYRWIPEKYRSPLSLVYGEVATHNHFVLDRGGKVFKQTAPVIKLSASANEDDHLALLGLLNSSTACFWLKQVCHNKGSAVDQAGARQRTAPFEDFFAFNATKIQQFPLPSERPVEVAKVMDRLVSVNSTNSPQSVVQRGIVTREVLNSARETWITVRRELVDLQESLDWLCYQFYNLIDEDLSYANGPVPCVELGQRAFEIVLARKLAAGETQTTWFERHGSTPITELPAEWPDKYRHIVERRISFIESDPNIRLIEQPEYKRRWNTESWESQLQRTLREWLLNRLESYFDFDGRLNAASRPNAILNIAIVTVARLADVARQDAEFQQVGELYRDDPAFDVQTLVDDLIAAESVPLLPILRYKPSGLRKRAEWERVWILQRDEDRLEKNRKEVRNAIECREDMLRSQSTQELGAVEVARKSLLESCRSLNKTMSQPISISDSDAAEDIADRLLLMGGDGKYIGIAMLVNDHKKNVLERKRLLNTRVFKACREDGEHQRLQRDLANIPSNPEIPVPPKYASADFLKSDFWRLRGKLDVCKERWISFPHCEGSDGTLAIAWAGYDHLQLARAISAYYVDIQERLGGRGDSRLVPLLACLLELLPWLKQWHNAVDPDFGLPMGDYFESFVSEEARQLGRTLPEIRAWTPPTRLVRRERRRKT